jgi:hypothetical protein
LLIVDIGSKVTKRIKELSDVGDIPQAFRDVRMRLPLVISIIVGTQQVMDSLSPEAQESFEEVANQCSKQVKELYQIVEKVTVAKGDSRLKRTFKAGLSVFEEDRVKTIATTLMENVNLLTLLNVTPVGQTKSQKDRRPSEPLPSYNSVAGVFLVPFSRDDHFVGRESILQSISTEFEKNRKLAISGMGGVG